MLRSPKLSYAIETLAGKKTSINARVCVCISIWHGTPIRTPILNIPLLIGITFWH